MIRNLSIYNLSGLRVPRTLLMLVLILIGTSVFAQTKQVTGVVKDATGETVIGASVVEKGTMLCCRYHTSVIRPKRLK